MSTAREMIDVAKREGYFAIKVLETGEVAALQRQIHTVGLIVFDEHNILKRWCFETVEDARTSLIRWDGKDDPPGNWIKQKIPVERMNPYWSKS